MHFAGIIPFGAPVHCSGGHDESDDNDNDGDDEVTDDDVGGNGTGSGGSLQWTGTARRIV